MEAFSGRLTSIANGITISLALVFGGSSAFAEGLTRYATPASSPGLIGSFAAGDLDDLEAANVAEAKASRLAETGRLTPAWLASRSSGHDADVQATEAELFPHSSRLVPLLVSSPAAVATLPAAVTLRPGLVQPVGVPRSAMRPSVR